MNSIQKIVQANDILIIEEAHRLKAKYIFDSTPSVVDVTCIGGCPGSGKSEVAYSLINYYTMCDIEAHHVKLDDLYTIDHMHREEWRRITGYVGKYEIDWHMVKARVDQIVRKQHAVAIIDGIYACYFNYSNRFKVFLDGTCKQTYEFRKVRGKEDPDNDFRKLVIQRECRSAQRSRKYADLMIPFDIKVS